MRNAIRCTKRLFTKIFVCKKGSILVDFGCKDINFVQNLGCGGDQESWLVTKAVLGNVGDQVTDLVWELVRLMAMVFREDVRTAVG